MSTMTLDHPDVDAATGPLRAVDLTDPEHLHPFWD